MASILFYLFRRAEIQNQGRPVSVKQTTDYNTTITTSIFDLLCETKRPLTWVLKASTVSDLSSSSVSKVFTAGVSSRSCVPVECAK